jgi:hypothetical protein
LAYLTIAAQRASCLRWLQAYKKQLTPKECLEPEGMTSFSPAMSKACRTLSRRGHFSTMAAEMMSKKYENAELSSKKADCTKQDRAEVYR